eukprot:13206-Heterococcus_DN1.PRE.8
MKLVQDVASGMSQHAGGAMHSTFSPGNDGCSSMPSSAATPAPQLNSNKNTCALAAVLQVLASLCPQDSSAMPIHFATLACSDCYSSTYASTGHI